MAVENTVEALIVGKFADQISVPAKQTFGQLESFASSSFAKIGALGASAAAAIFSLSAIKGGIDKMAEFEKTVVSVNASLKATGQYSQSFASEIQTMAGEISKAGLESKKQILDAMNPLIQFGAQKNQLRGLTEAAQDLSVGLGMDLANASFLLSKALEGNTTMLGRYGIKVDAALSSTEKMDAIIKQINQKFGGQDAAQLDTYSGRMVLFDRAVGGVSKALGEMYIKSEQVNGSISFLTSALNGIKKGLSDYTAMTDTSLEGLVRHRQLLMQSIQDPRQQNLAVVGGVAMSPENVKKEYDNVNEIIKAMRLQNSIEQSLVDKELQRKQSVDTIKTFDEITKAETDKKILLLRDEKEKIIAQYYDTQAGISKQLAESKIITPDVLASADRSDKAAKSFMSAQLIKLQSIEDEKNAQLALDAQRQGEDQAEKIMAEWRANAIKELMADKEEADKQEWDGITKINALRDESWNRQMELQRQLLADRDAATQKEIEDALYVDNLQWEIDKERDRRGKEITDSLRTETEIYSDEVRRLAGAYNEAAISAETFKRGVEEAYKKMSETNKIGQDLSHVVGTAFEDAIIGGKKFSDILKGLEQDIIRLALRAAIIKPLQRWFEDIITGGGSTGGGRKIGTGGFVESALNFFGGGATSGASSTAITESAFLAGDRRGTTIVMNISTPDVNGFVRNQGAILNNMNQAVRRGARNS